MRILGRHLAAWLGLFVVYLAAGVGLEFSLHVFRGDWRLLLTLAVGMPTALVGGYAFSQWFPKR